MRLIMADSHLLLNLKIMINKLLKRSLIEIIMIDEKINSKVIFARGKFDKLLKLYIF